MNAFRTKTGWRVIQRTAITVLLTGCVTVSANENVERNESRILLETNGPMIRSGEEFVVDVLVDDVEDLQTFQVTLDTHGGSAGSLELEEIIVDIEDSEHAFAGTTVLQVANIANREAAAVQLSSAVDLQEPAVLATFYFRATDDAAGTFVVNTAGTEKTFLRDSNAVPIQCDTAAAVQVTIVGHAKFRTTAR